MDPGFRRGSEWMTGGEFTSSQDVVVKFNDLPHPEEVRRAVSKGADRRKSSFSQSAKRIDHRASVPIIFVIDSLSHISF